MHKMHKMHHLSDYDRDRAFAAHQAALGSLADSISKHKPHQFYPSVAWYLGLLPPALRGVKQRRLLYRVTSAYQARNGHSHTVGLAVCSATAYHLPPADPRAALYNIETTDRALILRRYPRLGLQWTPAKVSATLRSPATYHRIPPAAFAGEVTSLSLTKETQK